jgi:hypothetical protein
MRAACCRLLSVGWQIPVPATTDDRQKKVEASTGHTLRAIPGQRTFLSLERCRTERNAPSSSFRSDIFGMKLLREIDVTFVFFD